MSNLVQPIVVTKNTGSHLDVVVAVAQASVGAWVLTKDDPGCASVWDEWLSGPFTKTVRRADSKSIQQMFWEAEVVVEVPTDGEPLQALALLPQPYERFSKAVKRAQVQGLDRPRSSSLQQPLISSPYPSVRVNADLCMTTGKAAAQVAHAVFAWARENEPFIDQWWYDGAPMYVREVSNIEQIADDYLDSCILINDAGLTEVDPGSLTALVF